MGGEDEKPIARNFQSCGPGNRVRVAIQIPGTTRKTHFLLAP